MPCVSLAHRKIYRETVARRIEMRRLLRSTEKAAAKSAKKAARLQAAQTKAALKSVKKLSKETPQQTAKKTRKAMRLKQTTKDALQSQSLSQPQAQNQNLSTLHSNLISTAKTASPQPVQAQSPRTLVTYISSTMQDFREGVEVKVLHAKHRLSIDNPLATISTFAEQRTTGEGASRGEAYSSPELFVTNDHNALGAAHTRSSETVRSATSEEEVARTRDGGLRERRVSEERDVQAPRLFRHRPSRAELINAESSLGRTLFGPIPAGHRREFFHDRANIWIWHEGWTEPNREPHQMTIRYEVRPTGIFKKLSAGSYVALEGNELENFRRAAHAYLYLIKRNLYHLV